MKLYNKLVSIGNGEQRRYSFDKATLVKIGKGALIAGSGAIALYLLDMVGTVEFTDTNIAAFTAFVVPMLVNVVKEYLRGTE